MLLAGPIVEFVLLFVFTVALLWSYAVPGTNPAYFIVVLVSWYLGFCGTLLLPIDVEETIAKDPVPFFEDVWLSVYWITFILSWAVLPVMMEFYASGYFSFRARLRASLRSNLKFYAIVAVLGTVLIIFMAISNSWGPSALSGFLMAAANTYGMLLIVVMLGYGLVETPRAFWIDSDPVNALARLEYKAPEVEEAQFDAQCSVDECIAEAHRLDRLIPARDADLRRCMDVVVASLPTMQPGVVSAVQATSDATPLDPDLQGLAKLHTRIKACVPKLQKEQARWNALVLEAARLRAVIDGLEEPSHYDSASPPGKLTLCWRSAAWFYKSKLNRVAGKVIAVLMGIMSALVLWCELAIPIPADLSLFGLTIAAMESGLLKQIVVFIPYAYMSWCMYVALFKVKLFDAITLTPHRLTHAYALMFNATYLCRLQFVLAFNYLLVIKTAALDGHATAFEGAIGKNMELVPLFGTDFNNFIPLLLLVFALFTIFRVLDRIAHRVGVDGFGEYVRGRPDHEERRREGIELIKKSHDRMYRRRGRGGGRPPVATGGRRAGGVQELASNIRQQQQRRSAPRREHEGRTYTPPSTAAGGQDAAARRTFFSDIL